MPFAEAHGYEVYYEEHGEGDSVLLVAGLGCDTSTWAPQLDELSRHYRVLVFDNPGSGRTSGPPGPYSTEFFADVAAGLLDRLQAGPAHVVGLSMGGAIAQQLAVRSPDRVRSLSLHATWGRADRFFASVLRSWQSYARAVPRLELARQLWLWVYTVWYFNDRPEAIAELERWVAEHPAPQSAEDFCAQAEACIAHDTLDLLEEIRAPAYISVGDRDLLTPAHHAYAIKERMPAARLRVWQKMGHAPYWEIPEEFNARQLDFLREH
jgi:pimeloyl-ACP methyl ester carboxylesterase